MKIKGKCLKKRQYQKPLNGTEAKKGKNGTENTMKKQKTNYMKKECLFVLIVESSLKQKIREVISFAQTIANLHIEENRV